MSFSIAAIALSFANAQSIDTNDTEVVQYKSITELEFGDELSIDASLISPNGTVVSEATRPQFNPMLLIRMDFQSELFQSVDLIK
ncbi:MAG: hypothetical protein VXZ96_11260 [Myxococcota bacterium]|nr:hypothetical protein [Myxococcota bacterium]